MFRIGEYVVYGYSGVCLVDEITQMEVPGSRDKRDYYALVPVHSRGSRVYAPVDGKKPIRAIITPEEAEALILEIPGIEPLEVVSDKHREEQYKEVMKSCDCREWIRIIKTLNIRRQEREDMGKQSTAMDSRYWKSAEEYLFTELSLALEMAYEEVESYIREKIN